MRLRGREITASLPMSSSQQLPERGRVPGHSRQRYNCTEGLEAETRVTSSDNSTEVGSD